MITLENLQDAAVWAHENEIEREADAEFLDLRDTAVFAETYAQAFGLHPASVMVGIRLGYLAQLSADGVIDPIIEEEAEEESEGLVPLVIPDNFNEED